METPTNLEQSSSEDDNNEEEIARANREILTDSEKEDMFNSEKEGDEAATAPAVSHFQEGIVVMGMSQAGEIELHCKESTDSVVPSMMETSHRSHRPHRPHKPANQRDKEKEGLRITNGEEKLMSESLSNTVESDFELRFRTENDRMLASLYAKCQAER